MPIRTVTVLGAGTMGHGIAHAAAAGGYETRMYDVAAESIDKGRRAVEAIVAKGVELGKVTAAEADAIRRRLTATTSLPEALADTDFIIEAAPNFATSSARSHTRCSGARRLTRSIASRRTGRWLRPTRPR